MNRERLLKENRPRTFRNYTYLTTELHTLHHINVQERGNDSSAKRSSSKESEPLKCKRTCSTSLIDERNDFCKNRSKTLNPKLRVNEKLQKTSKLQLLLQEEFENYWWTSKIQWPSEHEKACQNKNAAGRRHAILLELQQNFDRQHKLCSEAEFATKLEDTRGDRKVIKGEMKT